MSLTSGILRGYAGQMNPAVPASIAISTTTSAEIATGGMSLVGIEFPAAFTGTAISFLVATSSGGTFQPMYNSSGLVTYTVAAARYLSITASDFYGAAFFKIVSNATELAARSLTLSMKGI